MRLWKIVLSRKQGVNSSSQEPSRARWQALLASCSTLALITFLTGTPDSLLAQSIAQTGDVTTTSPSGTRPVGMPYWTAADLIVGSTDTGTLSIEGGGWIWTEDAGTLHGERQRRHKSYLKTSFSQAPRDGPVIITRRLKATDHWSAIRMQYLDQPIMLGTDVEDLQPPAAFMAWVFDQNFITNLGNVDGYQHRISRYNICARHGRSLRMGCEHSHSRENLTGQGPLERCALAAKAARTAPGPGSAHSFRRCYGIQFTNMAHHKYAFHHIFDRVCDEHDIEHRLTRIRHPWTNGQVERMNRTIKEATVKRYHYDSHDQLTAHLQDFIGAYNYGRRLKTLRGLTPYESICKIWKSEPERFDLGSVDKRTSQIAL